MVQTGKMYGNSKRVGEMLSYLEAARLFSRDLLDTLRVLLDKGLLSAWKASIEELRFMLKRFTVVDYVFGNLSLLGLLLCFGVFLSGVGLLGYQSVMWLQDGVWNPLAMMLVFEFLFEGTVLGTWMQSPESWLGLHQLVEWILINTPISLALMVNGLLMSAALAGGIVLALLIRRFQFKHPEGKPSAE